MSLVFQCPQQSDEEAQAMPAESEVIALAVYQIIMRKVRKPVAEMMLINKLDFNSSLYFFSSHMEKSRIQSVICYTTK